MEYIGNHVMNVQKAYEEFKKVPEFSGELLPIILSVEDDIKNHDLSKYSDEEFDPYRRSFYPVDDEEKSDAEEDFKIAWEHHYVSNDHHWNHFLDEKGSPSEMPLGCIIHMICDWQGMSYKFSGDCESWYYENKKDITLHPDTEMKLEKLLKYYVKYLKRHED